jgi:hypothetical protein
VSNCYVQSPVLFSCGHFLDICCCLPSRFCLCRVSRLLP